MEAPAIGAAILAGLGTGLFATVHDALAVVLDLAPAVIPDPAVTSCAEPCHGWETTRGTVFPAFVTR